MIKILILISTNPLRKIYVSQIMNSKLTTVLMAGLFLLTASSCRHEIDCPGFDVEEDIMDWYVVPSLVSDISYVDSNSSVYVFNQTHLSASEAYTFKCGMFTKCGCSSVLLTSIYQNPDLDFSFTSSAFYTYSSRINLTHDSLTYELDVDLLNERIYSTDSLCTVTAIDTLTVFNTIFTDIFKVSSDVDSFKFWLKKDAGMIAFEKNNIMYKLD